MTGLGLADPAPQAFPEFELPAAVAPLEVLAAGHCGSILSCDDIPDIIRSLPLPLPGVGPRLIFLSAWPFAGELCLTLAVRRNAHPEIDSWYWAVEATDWRK